jgi:N-methylhydantoinase B/oxoprolinase/acetone carboxylase alpha subunit
MVRSHITRLRSAARTISWLLGRWRDRGAGDGTAPRARWGENWLLPGGDESRIEQLPDKCTIPLEAGDVLRMLTPGGGGWGRPSA